MKKVFLMLLFGIFLGNFGSSDAYSQSEYQINTAGHIIPYISEAYQRRLDFITERPLMDKDFRHGILNSYILDGMSTKMVIASWGDPTRINEIDSKYWSEQWVYTEADRYLYFDNNILVDRGLAQTVENNSLLYQDQPNSSELGFVLYVTFMYFFLTSLFLN